jgi:hypothetical protein
LRKRQYSCQAQLNLGQIENSKCAPRFRSRASWAVLASIETQSTHQLPTNSSMCTEEHDPRARYTHSYTLPPRPAISVPGHLPRRARDPLPIRRSLLKDIRAKEQRKSRLDHLDLRSACRCCGGSHRCCRRSCSPAECERRFLCTMKRRAGESERKSVITCHEVKGLP